MLVSYENKSTALLKYLLYDQGQEMDGRALPLYNVDLQCY